MTKTRTRYSLIAAIATILLVTGCTVSYKFNGASIDYTKTKTITIRSFTNNAPLVYPALAPMFNESLRDIYAKQTRLTQVTNNGDIELEGEITGYDTRAAALSSADEGSMNRLTVTIKVRFTNTVDPDASFEQSFSRYRDYAASRDFSSVESSLVSEIVTELCEDVFNKSVVNW